MKTLPIIGWLMFWMVASQLLAASAPGQPPDSSQSKPAAKEEVRQLALSNKPWTGDFDRMLVYLLESHPA